MTPDVIESRIHTAGVRAMVEEAARIRAELCADRGLPPSSGCLPAKADNHGDKLEVVESSARST